MEATSDMEAKLLLNDGAFNIFTDHDIVHDVADRDKGGDDYLSPHVSWLEKSAQNGLVWL